MPFDNSKPLFLKKGRKSKSSKKSGKRPTRITSKAVARQTQVNRVVSKVISKIGETKIQPTIPYFHQSPVRINSSPTFNNPTYVQGYVLGNKPASWSSGLTLGGLQYLDLGSFDFAKGSDADQRNGDYMYAKRSTLNLNVMMRANDAGLKVALPYRFRVITFRPKTSVKTPGSPSDPTTDLFIDTNGSSFGHGTSTSIGFMKLWQGILNRKDYSILSDKKFMLTAPGSKTKNDPGFDSHHVNLTGPHSKDYLMRIPYQKKVKYDNATNQPEDLNMATGILVYAQAVGDHKADSDLFETSIQGVSSFLDN